MRNPTVLLKGVSDFTHEVQFPCKGSAAQPWKILLLSFVALQGALYSMRK